MNHTDRALYFENGSVVVVRDDFSTEKISRSWQEAMDIWIKGENQ